MREKGGRKRIVAYPRFPEEFDRRRKLTVRKMIECLRGIGLTTRELAYIFGVSRTLFIKLKLTPEEARERRYKYERNTGNTPEYRQRSKVILKDKILNYRRQVRKKVFRGRKNRYSPRYSRRKYIK